MRARVPDNVESRDGKGKHRKNQTITLVPLKIKVNNVRERLFFVPLTSSATFIGLKGLVSGIMSTEGEQIVPISANSKWAFIVTQIRTSPLLPVVSTSENFGIAR